MHFFLFPLYDIFYLATDYLLSRLTQKDGHSLGQKRQEFMEAGVFSHMPSSDTLVDKTPNGINAVEVSLEGDRSGSDGDCYFNAP